MMKELKKIETDLATFLNVKEVVESCLENVMLDVQHSLQQNVDLVSMKTRSEVKDVMSQEQKKNLEACLRKHLKSISDQLEEMSQMYSKEQRLQESNLQAVADCGLNKIKLSLEECKTAFEKESSLLRQTEQRLITLKSYTVKHVHNGQSKSQRKVAVINAERLRLKLCTDRLFSDNCRHESYPRKCEEQSLQSAVSNTDATPHTVRLETEFGDRTRNCHWNRDYGHNQDRFGIGLKYFSDTNDVRQNKSFPMQNVLSQHFTVGRPNISSCLSQEPSRMTVVNKNVEAKKFSLGSKPDSFVSPFKRPIDIPINPSPVATVIPQVRINQTLPSLPMQGTHTQAADMNVCGENFKYDLRKRKIKEGQDFLYTVKEQKLQNKKNSDYKNTISYKTPEQYGKKEQDSKPNTVASRERQNFHNNVKDYLKGDQDKYPLSLQKKKGNIMNGRHNQKPFDAAYPGCKGARVPAYFIQENERRCIPIEMNQKTLAPSEIASGPSSPACSVYSLTMKTPQRHISTALSSRRTGSFRQPMDGRNRVAKHSTLSTLLTDL